MRGHGDDGGARCFRTSDRGAQAGRAAFVGGSRAQLDQRSRSDVGAQLEPGIGARRLRAASAGGGHQDSDLRSGAGDTLGAIALPNLRTFIRESCSLRASEVEAIASADWPNLEHLEIWTGSTIDGGTVALRHLVPILAGRGLPALRHLGIVNSDLAEELVPALARSTLLGQLDSLDLSRGAMARADALVEHAGAFRHLASLDLRKNVLAPDEIVRIRAVLDNVITTDQRDAYERAAWVASPDE